MEERVAEKRVATKKAAAGGWWGNQRRPWFQSQNFVTAGIVAPLLLKSQ